MTRCALVIVGLPAIGSAALAAATLAETATRVALGLAILLVSVSFHEGAHALFANWLGDPTPANEGRLTLNPLRHAHPLLTMLFPAFLMVATDGRLAFGAARPVPINANFFRNPSGGLALCAAAGPVANLILAMAGAALLLLILALHETVALVPVNAYFFWTLIQLNAMLFAVNLLVPIPPMDGSRVVRHFLGTQGRAVMDALEDFGLVIICLGLWAVYDGYLLPPMEAGARELLSSVFGESGHRFFTALRGAK